MTNESGSQPSSESPTFDSRLAVFHETSDLLRMNAHEAGPLLAALVTLEDVKEALLVQFSQYRLQLLTSHKQQTSHTARPTPPPAPDVTQTTDISYSSPSTTFSS